MKLQLFRIWHEIRASYWFLPTVMAVGSIGVAYGLLRVDSWIKDGGAELPEWFFTMGAEGARTLLGAVAGSMITVAGVAFSIVVVALTLASQQFGPRLLDNFMRDTGNQVVLGTFIASFIYDVLVMRSIRAGEEKGFLPDVSIAVALVGTLASLGVLIYFIHHVARSIQVGSVIRSVADDLEESTERLFPEAIGEGDDEAEVDPGPDVLADARPSGEPATVRAGRSGYVQAVDDDGILALAVEHDLVLELRARPGGFVAAESALFAVWPAERLDEDLESDLRAGVLIGYHRTTAQDVELPINELVEIAARALSPGINDPFTAIAVIDALAGGLSALAGRRMPSPIRRDEEGEVRVLSYPFRFGSLLDAAYHQIRQYARGDTAVTARLLEALEVVASRVGTRHRKEAVQRHAEMILRAAEALPEPLDRRDVEERFDRVTAALAERAGSPAPAIAP